MVSKKSKLSIAVSIALAAGMAVTLPGCMVEGDTTVSGGYHQANPKANVTGTVQDTNGYPLEGVTVYLAGKEATTDAGGIYRFDMVEVTVTTGTDGNQTATPLSVTIVPPEGYIGATVTVNPTAQIDGTTDNGGGLVNPMVTLIDGMLASAGTAVLPQMTTTLKGVVRTTLTGEPVANATLKLDLVSVNGVTQQQPQNGVTTTYAAAPFTVVSAEDGTFSFAGLPDDTTFALMVVDHNVNNGVNLVNTNAEGDWINIGDVRVTAIASADTIAPYVASVDGLMDPNTGMISRSVDTAADGIVVNFSETVSGTVDLASSVVIIDTTNNAYVEVASAELAEDGKSMTIKTATAVAEGTTLVIRIKKEDIKDGAGNMLAVNPNDAAVVGKDDAEYLTISLSTFQERNRYAEAVTGLVQHTDDSTSVLDDHSILQGYSDAFTDNRDGNGNIDQLNSTEAKNRLQALGKEVAGLAVAPTVTPNVAKISFTTGVASGYSLAFTNNVGWTVTDAEGVALAAPGNGSVLDLAGVAAGTEVHMWLAGAVADQTTVTITPYDGFGVTGTPATLTLADNTPPTTILQRAFAAGGNKVDGLLTVPSYGAGAELAQIGSVKPGTPVFNATAGLLDNPDSAYTKGQLDELYGLNDAVLPTGVYEGAAFTKFSTDLGRTIGVEFSENVAIVADTTPAYSGSATVNNWMAHPDVVTTYRGNPYQSDLLTFDVDSVLTLAADHGAVMDFTGVIQDNAGNVAGENTNAKVVVYDMMPPFVTSASYDGNQLVIAFNETLKAEDGSVTISGRTIPFLADDVDGNTITIADADGYSLITADEATAFPILSGDANAFATMDFRNVKDAHGNAWQAAQDAGVMAAPKFATVNATPAFGVTAGAVRAADTNDVVFTYTSGSHPLDAARDWTFVLVAEDGTETAASLARFADMTDPYKFVVTVPRAVVGANVSLVATVESKWDDSNKKLTTAIPAVVPAP